MMTWIVKVLRVVYFFCPYFCLCPPLILVTNVNLSTLDWKHECNITKHSYHCICFLELHFWSFSWNPRTVLVYFNWFLVCFNCSFFVCFSLLLFRNGWIRNKSIYRTIDPAWSSFVQYFSLSALYNHLTTLQVNKKHRIFFSFFIVNENRGWGTSSLVLAIMSQGFHSEIHNFLGHVLYFI